MAFFIERIKKLFGTQSIKVTYLEGNVAAGKSTLLTSIKKKFPDVNVAPEEVSKFTLLASRYRNPDRFFFSSQVQICMVHYETIRRALTEAAPGSHVVVERSIHASLCFADFALSKNQITNDEFEILKNLANILKAKLESEFNFIDRHVYLRCEPTQCFKHAKLRSRSAESNLTQEELSHLHQLVEIFCSGFITIVNMPSDCMSDSIETVASF